MSPEVSCLQLQLFSQHFPSAYNFFPARIRALIIQTNFPVFPVLQPAHRFRSKPAQAIHDSNKDRIEIQSTAATASEAMSSSYVTASPARSKSRTQVLATESKPALPMLRTTNLKALSAGAAAAATVATTDDRRRGRWALLFKSPPPPQSEILKTSNPVQPQQQHQTPLSLGL